MYIVPVTVMGAVEDEDETGVDEVAASSSQTAEETIVLRSSRDTVTVPELPPVTDIVGVIEGVSTQQRTSRRSE